MTGVAFEGSSITLNPSSLPPETLTITSVASIKVKAEGKGVYFGSLDGLVSNYSEGTFKQTPPTPIPFSIKGGAEKVGNSSGKVVLIGDTSEKVIIPLVDPSSGATKSVSVTFEVTEGSTKVKGV